MRIAHKWPLFIRCTNTWCRLLRECIKMYKSKEISEIGPIHVRDPSQIDEVFGSFSHNFGDGKVVFDYKPTSLFKVYIPRSDSLPPTVADLRVMSDSANSASAPIPLRCFVSPHRMSRWPGKKLNILDGSTRGEASCLSVPIWHGQSFGSSFS